MFFYFFKDRNHISLAEIQANNLAYAFDESTPGLSQKVYNGPLGQGPGMIHCRGERPPVINSDFKWFEIPEANDVLCGYDASKPINPLELQRSKIVGGNSVELAGVNWIIPKVRTLGGNDAMIDVLPARMKWDGSNFIVGESVDLELEAIADKAWAAFQTITPDSIMLPDDCIECCAKLFSTNYYIGPAEICELGLLVIDTMAIWDVLSQSIDMPAIEEFAKKKTETNGQALVS